MGIFKAMRGSNPKKKEPKGKNPNTLPVVTGGLTKAEWRELEKRRLKKSRET